MRYVTTPYETHASDWETVFVRVILLVGAVLGLLSVMIGASAEHALRPRVDDEVFRYIMTAIRYHQIGAVVVTAIGLALLAPVPQGVQRALAVSGWLFVAGTVLFSFSIYLSALLDMPGLTMITPVGGTTLMVAWAALAWAGWKACR